VLAVALGGCGGLGGAGDVFAGPGSVQAREIWRATEVCKPVAGMLHSDYVAGSVIMGAAVGKDISTTSTIFFYVVLTQAASCELKQNG